jgi:hypothetical protein
MIRRIICIFWLSALLCGCSVSKLGWKAESGSDQGEKGMVEDFDPLSLEDDDIFIEPAVKTPPREEGEGQNTNENIDSRTELTEKELVQGYRVQLLATKDEIQAREERKKAIFVLQGEDVYLEFESPNYKLRVGNCLDRKEAEVLRNKIIRIARQKKEKEWERAWIVRTRVEKAIDIN